jgi:hypothetical protein
MEGSHTSRFFLEPKPTFQRQYEALRAIFVDGEPIDQVADRFGYKSSALRGRLRIEVMWGIFRPQWPYSGGSGMPCLGVGP